MNTQQRTRSINNNNNKQSTTNNKHNTYEQNNENKTNISNNKHVTQRHDTQNTQTKTYTTQTIKHTITNTQRQDDIRETTITKHNGNNNNTHKTKHRTITSINNK